MKTILFWLGLVVFLAAGAWIVREKEQLLAHGRPVLLKLAPVDPRSLMQGDYMALRYDLDNQLPKGKDIPSRGRVIVRLDGDGVGQFARLDDGRPLAADEVALKYTRKGDFRIASESFFFEEGMGPVYQAAKFAELKVDDRGTCLLAALRDEKRELLGKGNP
jgi:uncharacterized membrane-anchored protein